MGSDDPKGDEKAPKDLRERQEPMATHHPIARTKKVTPRVTLLLPEQPARDVNAIASFLALSDFPRFLPTPASVRTVFGDAVVDAVALMGSSVLATAEHAYSLLRVGRARRLLISGGIGHSTGHLYESIARHPRYSWLSTEHRGEARLLAEIAIRFWGIDPALIVVEDESRHCGENAAFTLRTLTRELPQARTLLLLQDPTMQRRTAATFEKACAEARCELIIGNHPTFVPRVRSSGHRLEWDLDGQVAGLWPIGRFLSLVMGEIPRLRDDAAGYGPRGQGYLVHVEIPPSVLEAYGRLAETFPDVSR